MNEIEIWDEVSYFVKTGDLYFQFTEPREKTAEEMIGREVVDRVRKSRRIHDRYDKQEYRRVGGLSENMRKGWTLAQKRRMNKHFKKIGSMQRV